MNPRRLAVWVILAACSGAGCSLGPRSLHKTRLPYNEAIKITSEEQLLLNIVRLRYSDSTSSLAVTTIAAQFEASRKLQLVPFFAAAAAGNALGGYRGTVLPAMEFSGADRPTLSLTPQDETEYTRRLFTPLSLDGIIYLANTTWPIETVFRLYLENLNWVPNAQNASGPTPARLISPPTFDQFRLGIAALQRLQGAGLMAILLQESEERVGGSIPGTQVSARDMLEAAKANHEFKPEDEKAGKDGKGDARWVLTKKKDVPYLYISPEAKASPDWLEFCRAFKVKPDEKRYEIEVTKLTPFPSAYPPEGVKVIDLETRSLLQVLFFVAHGVEVPPEHLAAGLARTTIDIDGSAFDYRRVLGGLFEVKASKCRKRPESAAVAVQYLDHWYYIEAQDHDSRATFALLLYLSRLEVGTKSGGSPVLTLPISGR